MSNGEKLTGESRNEALRDMFGLMLHQAVAEGAILMAQSLPEGSEERTHWSAVASRAVPLAAGFLEGVKGKDYTSGKNSAFSESAESAEVDDQRQQKIERLAALEAEMAQLRTELGE